MGLVFSFSNFFIAKTSLANNWRSFSCSYLALVLGAEKKLQCYKMASVAYMASMASMTLLKMRDNNKTTKWRKNMGPWVAQEPPKYLNFPFFFQNFIYFTVFCLIFFEARSKEFRDGTADWFDNSPYFWTSKKKETNFGENELEKRSHEWVKNVIT